MIDWLEANSMSCFFVENLGVICPGCGVQRSFIALLKGEVLESVSIYPALIPFLFILCFLPLHLYFRFRHGASILKYTFIFTALLIVTNFIIKL